jgi:heterotetrameric sarcosine oxidase gamma subunit
VSEPVARSPIAVATPMAVVDGWEVSGRRVSAALAIMDCTPLAKVQVRARAVSPAESGHAAAALGVPFGRAARVDGVLIVGSGPGEWLAIGPVGQAAALAASLTATVGAAAGELVTVVDLTHGRALLRLAGRQSAALLAKVCWIDLSDDVTPNGAAFRSSVAAVATDVVRDDHDGIPGYLLHCERSSGQYLFSALVSAGAEFGIQIDGFHPPT